MKAIPELLSMKSAENIWPLVGLQTNHIRMIFLLVHLPDQVTGF